MKMVYPWRSMFKAALTSCTVMSAGDIACQLLQRQIHIQQPTSINTNKSLEIQPIDFKQTARFALIGLTLHGPAFFTGFRWVDNFFKHQPPSLKQAVTKVALGQVLFFPPYIASFYAYLGLLEGLSLSECKEKVAKLTPVTLINGSLYWPVVNVFNFLYVPSTARVAYVNFAGLFWNAYLSYVNTPRSS